MEEGRTGSRKRGRFIGGFCWDSRMTKSKLKLKLARSTVYADPENIYLIWGYFMHMCEIKMH